MDDTARSQGRRRLARLLRLLQQARATAISLADVLPPREADEEDDKSLPSREDAEGIAWQTGLAADLLGAYDGPDPSPPGPAPRA